MSNIPVTGHSSEQGRYAMKGLLLGALAFLICAIIILSSVPPVSKDELVHHLALPKLYLKHGGMYEIPFMPFSYYPMNLQLLYMIPLYFGNDIVPKIDPLFLCSTAWLIFSYLKKRTSAVYALAGVLLFLSIPVVVKLSITAYIDLGIIFFSTASLLWLLKWRESGFKKKFLVTSGVFCGLGLGNKIQWAHHPVFVNPLCGISLCKASWRRKRHSGTDQAGVAGLGLFSRFPCYLFSLDDQELLLDKESYLSVVRPLVQPTRAAEPSRRLQKSQRAMGKQWGTAFLLTEG